MVQQGLSYGLVETALWSSREVLWSSRDCPMVQQGLSYDLVGIVLLFSSSTTEVTVVPPTIGRQVPMMVVGVQQQRGYLMVQQRVPMLQQGVPYGLVGMENITTRSLGKQGMWLMLNNHNNLYRFVCSEGCHCQPAP